MVHLGELMIAGEKWVLVPRAAERIGVSREYLYRLVRNGTLRSRRYHGQLFIPFASLERLQSRRGENPVGRKSYAQIEEELQEANGTLEGVDGILDDGDLSGEEKLEEIYDLMGWEDQEDDDGD